MKALLLVPALVVFAAQVSADPAKTGEDVTVTGKLRTGVFAIGGETTGTTVTAKGVAWELEFGARAALRKAAEKLEGKTVTVRGRLERRKGVEVGERRIITVTSLEAAEAALAPALKATSKRADSRVRFERLDDATAIDITSASGIGSATIEREAETWPHPLLVRLHLSGLESFKASVGELAVEWSVASTGDHPSRVALRKGRAETPLDKGSPYYSELKILGDREIPLEKGGYFDVPLPAKLLDGNPQKLTLRWIDFYRG